MASVKHQSSSGGKMWANCVIDETIEKLGSEIFETNLNIGKNRYREDRGAESYLSKLVSRAPKKFVAPSMKAKARIMYRGRGHGRGYMRGRGLRGSGNGRPITGRGGYNRRARGGFKFGMGHGGGIIATAVDESSTEEMAMDDKTSTPTDIGGGDSEMMDVEAEEIPTPTPPEPIPTEIPTPTPTTTEPTPSQPVPQKYNPFRVRVEGYKPVHPLKHKPIVVHPPKPKSFSIPPQVTPATGQHSRQIMDYNDLEDPIF